MNDYDGKSMDDLAPLSSPSIREAYQNENGLNPICEIIPRTYISTDPQPEPRSGGLRNRIAAGLGFDIPLLEIERISPFANHFSNPVLVPSPTLEISPGFCSLSPLLQSPNVLSNSSSYVIPPCPIPNDTPPEMVESSDGAHATMIISNNNLSHQPMDIDLPLQGGYDDIPTEESDYITSHKPNANPIGVLLVPSFDSEVVAETDVMNLISFESGSKEDDKDREYNQEGDKFKDHNVGVEPPSRKRKFQVNVGSYYICTYTGCNVKKYVERCVENVKLVVATYIGIHEHVPPPERIGKYGTKNQFGSSMSQDPRNQTFGLVRLHHSSLASQHFPSALTPQLNVTSLPVDKNHGGMNRNDEPKTDL